MEIYDFSLINQNPSNTGNEHEEISFGENNKGNEPSPSSVFTNTLKTFLEDERENITGGASKVTFQDSLYLKCMIFWSDISINIFRLNEIDI